MKMSHLPLGEDRPSNPVLASLYREASDMLGTTKPPNLLRSMAIRPDLAEAVWGLTKQLLVEGRLPASLSQMIVLIVSAQYGCRYCALAHQRALEALGIDGQIIERCVADPATAPIPDLHREILLFAKNAAGDPGAVLDRDIQSLRDHGLADGEIVEVAMIVAQTKLLNTWAEATAIPADDWTKEEQQI